MVLPYEGMTAVGYCRVSTDDKGQTNETQANAIKEWASKTGADLVQIYYDEMTGTTLSRPGLMGAVGRILCDNIRILVAFDQSRLTRNEDLRRIKEMIGSGCSIRYVTSDIDPESIGGRVTDAIKQIFDKEENRIRADKTTLGMATRRDVMGIHVGRPAKLVFLEELDSCKKGLSVQPNDTHVTSTMIQPLSAVMRMADEGKSLNYVATKVLGVKTMTLRRALIRVGMLEEFNERSRKAREVFA